MASHRVLLVGCLLVGVGAVSCSQAPGPTKHDPIEVRAIFALTGPTSEIGVSYSKGILDALRDANADGGILGRPVVMEHIDYKYDGPTAVAVYNDWKSDAGAWPKVSTIFGWGTNGTVELAGETAHDQKPFISASYAGTIGSPAPVTKSVNLPDGTVHSVNSTGAPYNFYAGTDYSTSIRLALDFAKQRGAFKVAFAYCSAGYCTEPIPAGKVYADALRLTNTGDLGPTPGDLRVELTDTQDQVDTKVRAFFDKHPDTEWLWVGNTRKTAVYIAKAVHAARPNVKLIVNVFGFDEAVYAECGGDCVDRSGEGGGAVFGVIPFAAYGDLRYPGMEEVLRIHDAYRRTDEEDLALYSDLRYVQGYVSFAVWRRAVERVIGDGQEINGPNIKAALESFSSIDTGGLTAPISFTATDHRPNSKARIYSINSFGKLEYQDERSITLLPEWLGW
jgi:hypothetical protein